MERTRTAPVVEGETRDPLKYMGKMSNGRGHGCDVGVYLHGKLEKIAMGSFKWYHWVLIGAGSLAMFIGVTLVIWFGFYRGEVASYGAPSKTYFKSLDGDRENVVGVEGQEIFLCFDDIVWKQICPSRLITNLTPAKGWRLDLPSREIDNPPVAERVPPKCRRWKVPQMSPDQEPGVAVLAGHMRSECTLLDHWYPIYTPMPSAKFNWMRAR